MLLYLMGSFGLWVIIAPNRPTRDPTLGIQVEDLY